MKALVVGGNGFIGSHLVNRLVELGWEVVVLDLYDRRYDELPKGVRYIRGDVGQPYAVREAITGADAVFHMAWTTIHETANEDPVADIESNLVPSIQLMQACRKERVSRIVFLSSGGTVYGPVESVPTPESHPLEPITAYGITKLAVEKYLRLFHRLYGSDYVILRPSVPYGPRQNPLGKQGAVAVFMYRIAHGLPITIWGDGSISRDYFYVGDLVEAMVLSAQAELNGRRVFNLGGGREFSLQRLVRHVEKVVGKEAVIEYQAARAYDVPRLLLKTDLAAAELGWAAMTDLQTGLFRTWEWMRAALD